MTTFLLLLKCFFWSILSTLLRVVLPSVTILLLSTVSKYFLHQLDIGHNTSEAVITNLALMPSNPQLLFEFS